jgi:hypothetical protein
LGAGVVVTDEVGGVETESVADLGVGEVERRELLDTDASDPPDDLEGIKTFGGEVAHLLSPCGLLLTGGIPDAGAVLAVIAAIGDRRVGKGRQ